MAILQVDNLTFSYPDAARPALFNVGFSLEPGSITVLYGPSGCGKSTLLKLLKKELAPYGKMSGTRSYRGISYEKLDARTSASKIAYLSQDPDSQIVADVVWQELACAPENLGWKTEVIRARVAEMAAYFGIESWFHKKTTELSGGQKQLLNLASVMTLEPEILLLDEPTAQLDPIAAGDFYAMLERLHRELGVTILIAEHRLEEILKTADHVLFLDQGEMKYNGRADRIGAWLTAHGRQGMAAGLPAAVRLYALLNPSDTDGEDGKTPLTVPEGREYLRSHFGNAAGRNFAEPSDSVSGENGQKAAELKDVWFRYGRNAQDVLRGASLTVYEGEHYCLLGGNGSGKTTLLKALLGTNRAYAGTVKLFGKPVKAIRDGERNRGLIAMLPQNPKDVFVCDVVRDDWRLSLKTTGVTGEACEQAVVAMAERLGASGLLDRHPYDLSGGEQQKVALGKVLLLHPRILLLDEPTKGLDASYKQELLAIIKGIQADGTTLLTVTHDTEWAALCADRIGLFFDGDVSVSGKTREVLSANAFYTTPACRIARGFLNNVITCEEIAELCLGNGGEVIPDGKKQAGSDLRNQRTGESGGSDT